MPSTFSYLPPGTPPWPSTPLPKMPYPNETQGTQQASADASAASKPKRTGRPLLAALIFLVLIPLLGAGATLGLLYSQGLFPPNTKQLPKVAVPTAGAQTNTNGTATPSAAQGQGNMLPTPTSYKKAANQDINMSMQYPADWVAEAPSKSASDTTLLIHPPQSQQIPFEVVIRRLNDSASSQVTSASDMNSHTVSDVVTQFSGANQQSVSPPDPQPMIAGVNWTEADATFQITGNSGNNVTLHVITISVQRSKDYYNIFFITQEVIYSEAAAKYVQPMLNSVQFLS